MRHPRLHRIERLWLAVWGGAAVVAWLVTHL